MRRLLLLILALTALAMAACGGDEEDPGVAPGEKQALEADGAVGPTTCERVALPEPRDPSGQKKPKGRLDASRVYELTFKTNCGDFTIRLDPRTAPNTGKSVMALAEADYYDDTPFHRIVPGYLIQGGDPTFTGGGDPGYDTVDEPPSDTTYTKGMVAMAKGDSDPPGTAGSQFFILTGDDGEALPPDYAVLGKVTEGMEVVEKIGVLGDLYTEQPSELVLIQDVTVEVS